MFTPILSDLHWVLSNNPRWNTNKLHLFQEKCTTLLRLLKQCFLTHWQKWRSVLLLNSVDIITLQRGICTLLLIPNKSTNVISFTSLRATSVSSFNFLYDDVGLNLITETNSVIYVLIFITTSTGDLPNIVFRYRLIYFSIFMLFQTPSFYCYDQGLRYMHRT